MARPRKEPPPIGQVEVESKEQGKKKKTKRSGRNLDHVLGWIISDLRERAGLTQDEFAERVGIPKTTIGDIERRSETSTSLKTVSKICAGLSMQPDALFQHFPAYRPAARDSVRFADDVVFDRFRSTLTRDQAKELLAILNEAERRDVLDQFLELSRAQFNLRHHKRKRPTHRDKAANSGD